MTKPSNSVTLVNDFRTKSGKSITIGTGTGTKWKIAKADQSLDTEQYPFMTALSDQLLLALENGFNHIDTAENYRTHPEVADAVKRSGIRREDLWITTKYSPGFNPQKAFSSGPKEFIEKTLKEFNTDYLDLVLIHSPFFEPDFAEGQTLDGAWKELLEAKKSGKARYIGVSNFSVKDIEHIFKLTESRDSYPAVNQIEFHPFLQNQSKGIQKFCKENNILIEAYSPLTPFSRVKDDDNSKGSQPLKSFIQELAKRYDRTNAQILLKYTLQKGIMPITTSSKLERIRESLDVINFSLDTQDVLKIDKLGSNFYYRVFFSEYYGESDV